MKLTLALLILASTMAASDAHASSTSAAMGVGLTIIPECRAATYSAAPRSAVRARVRSTFRGANSPLYVTTRSATAASPEILTMTY